MLVQTLQRRHGRGRFEVCRARFGFGELQQASWQLALHLLVPRSSVECLSRRSNVDTVVGDLKCVGRGLVLGSSNKRVGNSLYFLVPRSGVECLSRHSSVDTVAGGLRCVGRGLVLGSCNMRVGNSLYFLVPRSSVECLSRRSSVDTVAGGLRCVGGGFVLGSATSELATRSTFSFHAPAWNACPDAPASTRSRAV